MPSWWNLATKIDPLVGQPLGCLPLVPLVSSPGGCWGMIRGWEALWSANNDRPLRPVIQGTPGAGDRPTRPVTKGTPGAAQIEAEPILRTQPGAPT